MLCKFCHTIKTQNENHYFNWSGSNTGEKSSSVKYTKQQIVTIRLLKIQGNTNLQISQIMKIPKGTIAGIVKPNSTTWINLKF